MLRRNFLIGLFTTLTGLVLGKTIKDKLTNEEVFRWLFPLEL